MTFGAMLMIVSGVGLLSGAILHFSYPTFLSDVKSKPPISQAGQGGDAKVGGNGLAIAGTGGNVGGGPGLGGAGGGAEVSGNGIAAGGAGGSVDGDKIWYPPAQSGYVIYMESIGQKPDPALKKIGRGGMSAGYAPKYELVEKLRAEYFQEHAVKPESVDEDIAAVPLEYINEKLRSLGEPWRARIDKDQYVFFID